MNANIIKNIIFGVAMFVIMAIQTSNIIAIFDVNPDLIMISVILFSIYFGEHKGEIFGFAMGLVEDVMSGALFGINAFVLTLVAWLISIYRKFFSINDIVAYLIYVVLATIVKYILYFIFHLIFARTSFLDGFYILKMAGEIAYNAALGALLFYLAPLVLKREESLY